MDFDNDKVREWADRLSGSDTGLTYEFYSAMFKNVNGDNYLVTIYEIGEYGSNVVIQFGYNVNAETVQDSLKRNGYSIPDDYGTAHLTNRNGSHNGMVLIVKKF